MDEEETQEGVGDIDVTGVADNEVIVRRFRGKRGVAMGQTLKNRVTQSREAMSPVLERIRTWRDMYEKIPQSGGSESERSDVFVPKTREVVDTMASRVHRILTTPRPMVDAKVQKVEDFAFGQKLQDYLDWQLREQVLIEDVLDKALRLTFIDSIAIALVGWQVKSSIIRSLVPITDQVLDDLAASGMAIPEGAADNIGGNLELETEEVIETHPSVKIIPLDKFVLYPHNSVSVDAAIMVGHQELMTQSDLLQAAKDGYMDPRVVKALIRKGEWTDAWDEVSDLKEDADMNAGLESPAYDDAPEVAPYEVWELLCKVDLGDRDGILTDVRFRLEYSTGTILYAKPFDDPVPTGERPYTPLVAYPRLDSFYPYSLPEIIWEGQAILNDIYNQNLDAGAIENLILFGRRPTAKTKISRKPFYQGDIIEMDDPGDMWQISIDGKRQGAFADQDRAERMILEVAGLSPYQMGQPGPSERTLGEVENVLAEGNEKLEVIIRRLSGPMGLGRIIQHILCFDRAYITEEDDLTYLSPMGRPDPETGEAMPEGGIKRLTFEELRTRARISVRGTPDLANRSLAIQKAEKLVMLLAESPLTQTRMERVHAVSREAIKAFGFPNYTDFIGSEDEARQMDLSNAQKPPTPPMAITGRADEITTLAEKLKEDNPEMPFVERFTMAIALGKMAQETLMPEMPGTLRGDLPDNAPGVGMQAGTQAWGKSEGGAPEAEESSQEGGF